MTLSHHQPRVVVDTSVLAAGIAGFKLPQSPMGANPNADLLRRWLKRDTFLWLFCDEILEEYKFILNKKKVRSAVIGRIINLVKEIGEEVEITVRHEISPDSSDNPFCDCAMEGFAEYIVTNNAKDFPEGLLQPIKIVNPSEFLQPTVSADFLKPAELLWGRFATYAPGTKGRR